MQDFTDATVLVTGAASGIGLATARLLQERGARLILTDLSEEGLAPFSDARRIVGDVTDEQLWRKADLSGLTHAVVNAGIAAGSPITEMRFADWRRVISVNLDGAFLTLQAAMRAMRKGGNGGAIAVTASAAGLKAEPGIAAYGASKAAVIQLARIAAKEGAPDRIRVNAVAPGGVETPIWNQAPFFREMVKQVGSEEAAYAAMASMATPLARFAQSDEIAEQIAFLLSDKCGFVTGHCFVSDGGYTL